MSKRKIEIMDTTLRDGEQTSSVSFSSREKLIIAKLLLRELEIDRIEIASTRVSEGEFVAVKAVMDWATRKGFDSKVEVLSFVDNGLSIDWMNKTGAKVQNLLTKGSLNHLTHQLKKSPQQHFDDIDRVLTLAEESNIETNVYLEDWSNGMSASKDYVYEMLEFLSKKNVKRILLPDTLGILTPKDTFDYISEIKTKFPNLHLDFHAHNDYDLAVANTMSAVKAGADGIHVTVNGLGERAGNTPMASIVAVINDLIIDSTTSVNEKSIYNVSKLVENFSGFRIPENKPVLGENVFTQTAGIHADGDSKNNLYFNDLMPERFGRKRQYALGKTSGKANIEKNLQELGVSLNDSDIAKITKRIIELGDKKEVVTQEDLPYIISDVLQGESLQDKIKINSYVLTHSKDLRPSTAISITIGDKTFEESAQGDGQYDAFINSIKKIYKNENITLPSLIDYNVSIPPGSASDALCETVITWKKDEDIFKTRGLDSDQTVSAIVATQKMLNII